MFRDLSLIEIEELVSLIEQEIKKQEEKAKGQELPSIFEQSGNEPNKSIFDTLIELAEYYQDESEHSSSEELELVREKVSLGSVVSKPNTNGKQKSLGYELFEARAKAIEQSLRYLDLTKK